MLGFLVNAGILRDKTMDVKFVYIPNYGNQKTSSERLKLMVEKFDTLILEPTNHKSLGTLVVSTAMSPPSLSKSKSIPFLLTQSQYHLWQVAQIVDSLIDG